MSYKVLLSEHIILHLTSSMIRIFREVSITRVIVLLF